MDEAISSGHLDGGGEQQGSLLGQGCLCGMGVGLLLPTHPYTELGPGLEGEAGSGIWLVQALCGTEWLRSLGT